MTRYLLRQAGAGLLTLFGVATGVFFLVQLIMPGDFASSYLFLGWSAEQKAALRAELGLDQPLLTQYVDYMGGLVRGDLGISLTDDRTPVAAALAIVTPRTAIVFVPALLLASVLGIWLGKYAGWRRQKPASEMLTFTALGMYAIFPPALAFVLSYFLIRRWEWLPNQELWFQKWRESYPTQDFTDIMAQMLWLLVLALAICAGLAWLLRRFARFSMPLPLALLISAGLWAAGCQLAGIGLRSWLVIQLIAVPVIAATLLMLGELLILTRTGVADTIHEQYIQTARAKGLSERLVRDRHAMPNAVLPVLSRLAVSLPYLFGGMAILEYSLNWPGLGTLLFTAANYQNIYVLMGCLLLVGALTISARLLLDLAILVLDPRIQRPA